MSFGGPIVFCMNLRFGRADDGANGWDQRHRIVARLMAKYPAEFYMFQEVNDFQYEDLQRFLPRYNIIGRRYPAPDWWQNNLIFYHPKWKCTASHHFYLSQTPDVPSKFDDSKWPRQCTMGLFTQAGQNLICITTHFDFDPSVQVKSAHIVLNRLNAMSSTAPAILTGDFNATPADPCYKVFSNTSPPLEKKLLGTQKHLRLKGHQARSNHNKSAPAAPPTFKNAFSPPYPSTHHGFSGHATGGMIDWILYRGDLVSETAHIIKDTFDDNYPSDHFPLMAHFRWSK